MVLSPAQKLAPFDPLLRHRLATALYALGRKDEADKLISRPEDVHSEFGPWLAQHGRWLGEQGQDSRSHDAFRAGFWLSPLDPEVSCEEKLPPELPSPPEKGAICQSARKVLQD